MRRARTRNREHILRLGPPRHQRAIRDAKRPPAVAVFEDETLVVHAPPVAQHPPHAVRVRRPEGHGHRIVHLQRPALRSSVLGDHVVRHHAPPVAHVQLPREVAVVGELVAAVAEGGPGGAVAFLRLREEETVRDGLGWIGS